MPTDSTQQERSTAPDGSTAVIEAAVERALTGPPNTSPVPQTTPAGAGLLDEAETLVAAGRTKKALDVFEVARSVIDDPARDREVLARMVVVASDAGRMRPAARYAAELRGPEAGELELSAADWHALAVHEARVGRVDRADTCAREALRLDDGAAEPWADLATSFAGLGWFDEARECLDAAERRSMDDDRGARTPQVMARIGRAVNEWSLRQTHATTIAVVGVILLNLLGLAIALTVPFLVRSARIARIAEPFAIAAKQDWLGRHGLRLGRALAVLVLVVTWLALTAATGVEQPPN